MPTLTHTLPPVRVSDEDYDALRREHRRRSARLGLEGLDASLSSTIRALLRASLAQGKKNDADEKNIVDR